MELIKDQMMRVVNAQRGALNDLMANGFENDPTLKAFARNHNLSIPDAITVLLTDAQDIAAMGVVAQDAETIIFDANFALSLRQSLHRFSVDGGVKLRLPFPSVIYQFSRPIPDEVFFVDDYAGPSLNPDAYKASSAILTGNSHFDGVHDSVLGLAVGYEEIDGTCLYNAFSFHLSGEMNRVAWKDDEAFTRFHRTTPLRDQDRGMTNKAQLVRLATAMTLYVTCANVKIQRHETPAKVNAKRVQKGKRALPPYHTTYIARNYDETTGERASVDKDRDSTGRKVSFMFPVSGHFRHYPNYTLWIGHHYRGLNHANKPLPKVYKATKRDWSPR